VIQLYPGEIIVDSFAGGGGASCGIELGAGRSPDIAINHDAEAIALHAANHPGRITTASDVWRVDPVAACAADPWG
jgi:DNA (cytosine-5)-methyltransferase 1